MWQALPGGGLRILQGPGFTSPLHDVNLPGGAPLHIAAGDRDGGNTPELFALYPAGSSSRVEVLGFQGGLSVQQSLNVPIAPEDVRALGAADYDGDGRSDLQILSETGTLSVHVGNTPTGAPATRWFARPNQSCQDPVRLAFSGLFFDDAGSVFTNAIERLGASGITKGCNPPFNDRFCPREPVTRGQMAAFLVRPRLYRRWGRQLVHRRQRSHFRKRHRETRRGRVTLGCNPPSNDRFCPNDRVTRGEMAAFLVRALGYTDDGGGNRFTDDNGHVFENAIDKLAAAGVTLGCNPPPTVGSAPTTRETRGEMAAFLVRALRLLDATRMMGMPLPAIALSALLALFRRAGAS